MSTEQLNDWERDLASMVAEWDATVDEASDPEHGTIARWSALLEAMSGEMGGLRSAGRWLGGPRTLLEALGRQHSELDFTSALAWLLEPEGHHRLGDRVLEGLIRHLQIPVTALHPVRIVCEETCNDTRSDMIIRLPGGTILLEAKVRADEQRDQCARLAEEWAEEDPTLVFLTRDGRLPKSAGESESRWIPLRWAHFVGFIEGAISQLPPGREPAPGVIDLLKTLIEFHGGKA
ncbi:PD-(D/E)XK nuclease superfamily protein [Geodermatophilus africanus]|uniref:PD-(D/E)XK nuclease superfamily protein n=1 Tax=Geodermatophilus africanus TaxID=1137993 RepID=A0A1H3KCU5_9ACTN|nr:PD-(D/E)XK nuclease family protein [Geodermatophilus africanus]SDY49759.1 PD-(D/E)XK nuclease superfamily protein [Geodermatophilus africanus]